jgi:hypothetical protein
MEWTKLTDNIWMSEKLQLAIVYVQIGSTHNHKYIILHKDGSTDNVSFDSVTNAMKFVNERYK